MLGFGRLIGEIPTDRVVILINKCRQDINTLLFNLTATNTPSEYAGGVICLLCMNACTHGRMFPSIGLSLCNVCVEYMDVVGEGRTPPIGVDQLQQVLPGYRAAALRALAYRVIIGHVKIGYTQNWAPCAICNRAEANMCVNWRSASGSRTRLICEGCQCYIIADTHKLYARVRVIMIAGAMHDACSDATVIVQDYVRELVYAEIR